MKFLSCDWGTTTFRVRLVDGEEKEPKIRGEIRTSDGCRSLSTGGAAGYARVLEAQALAMARQYGVDENLPVVISGMASSSIGWRELPYAHLPFSVDGDDLRVTTMGETRLILLVSGVADTADVMRGEESEVIGLFQDDRFPQEAGEHCRLILPGTHSKHIDITQRSVTSFRTHMTGELFEILARHSVLARSLPDPETRPETDLPAFRLGIERSGEGALTHLLFSVRTNQLFETMAAPANHAYLSGMLIGHELHDLLERDREGPLVIGTAGPLAALYREGLETLGAGKRLRPLPPDMIELAVVRAHQHILQRHASIKPLAPS